MREKEPVVEILEEDEDLPYTGNPLHVLLIRVLHQAMMDLISPDVEERLCAYEWFQCWDNYLPTGLGVSYGDVREHIALTESQLRQIDILLCQSDAPIRVDSRVEIIRKRFLHRSVRQKVACA